MSGNPGYVCGHASNSASAERLAGRFGFSIAEAYADELKIRQLALESQKNTGSAVCTLPFCCTLEGELLGARINYGDAQSGPRPGGYIYNGMDELLAGLEKKGVPDWSLGRMGKTLAAVRILKNEGKIVAFEISGPLTIVNCLMDLARLFKAWRKTPEQTQILFDRLCDWLFALSMELTDAGVDVISYADPSSDPGIIGPKFSESLSRDFVIPFLSRLSASLPKGRMIHVCPRTAHFLAGINLAAWHEHDFGRPIAYAEACANLAGAGVMFGAACIKQGARRINSGRIKTLMLNL